MSVSAEGGANKHPRSIRMARRDSREIHPPKAAAVPAGQKTAAGLEKTGVRKRMNPGGKILRAALFPFRKALGILNGQRRRTGEEGLAVPRGHTGKVRVS